VSYAPAKIAALASTRYGSCPLKLGSPVPGQWKIEVAEGSYTEIGSIPGSEVFGRRAASAIKGDRVWCWANLFPLVARGIERKPAEDPSRHPDALEFVFMC
jgi:hypothetical protein